MIKNLKSGYLAEQVHKILAPMVTLHSNAQRQPGIDSETKNEWKGEFRQMLFFATKVFSLAHGRTDIHDAAVERMLRQGIAAYSEWRKEMDHQTDWKPKRCRRCAHPIEDDPGFCGKCGLAIELGNQFPRNCTSCRKSVWFTDRYCRYCGIKFIICPEHGTLVAETRPSP